MKTSDVLYMFAIVPPVAVAGAVQQERLAFADKYGFVKGLKPPVHITLFPPFKIPVEDTAEFEQRMMVLNDWAGMQQSFDIYLDAFGFFSHSRHPVVFIQVSDNQQLQALHGSFLAHFSPLTSLTDDGPYRPHVTIGYRDIAAKAFPSIRKEYEARPFEASFKCDAIFLWKHDGSKWQTLQEFPFSEPK
jgi:2'-5' RNA ligase